MKIKNIQLRIDDLTAKFKKFSVWEERYEHLIKMGKALPVLPDEHRNENNKVKGCQSQVWMFASLDENGSMKIVGDSDALIVKGLLAILLEIYDEASPEDVLKFKPDFIKEIGFEQNLSPSRANGLFAMIRQIQYYATAFAIIKMRK